MRDTVLRFLQFDAQNVIPEVYMALGAVWVVVVLVSLFSVASQPFAWGWKLLWAGVIVAAPLAGLALYSLFCLTRADYSFVKQFGLFSR